ncbi:olfactory receptor 10J4-like [Cynoglossus semilaevis]|uniref:Olfactory receptor n=1 Tax=Cynoglossus semilaevis TaxID=244447 RepID=A0A3P8X0M8_CYNSE|nr:olfactory receptor 10J4-like [Cynoglossus semilaevis]
MEDEMNVTYITFTGHINVPRYRYVYFVVMLMLYILIIFCNSTIVCLIVIKKNLHKPMYVFIAALLINSVLYSTVIHPKLLIDFLSPRQLTTFHPCLFQATVYYTFSISEFLLLSAMAYDRYVSICKPLQYQNIMRRSTVVIFLLSAWIVPASELGIMFILYLNIKVCHFSLRGIFCNTTIYTLQCVRSGVTSVYGVVILLNICLLPVLFILFTYTRVLIVSNKSSRKVQTKATQTCLPHMLVLINLSVFITLDVVVVRIGAHLPKLANLVLSLQMTVSHPLLNPFIYGLKMKEISKHLQRLLFQLRSHREVNAKSM